MLVKKTTTESAETTITCEASAAIELTPLLQKFPSRVVSLQHQAFSGLHLEHRWSGTSTQSVRDQVTDACRSDSTVSISGSTSLGQSALKVNPLSEIQRALYRPAPERVVVIVAHNTA